MPCGDCSALQGVNPSLKNGKKITITPLQSLNYFHRCASEGEWGGPFLKIEKSALILEKGSALISELRKMTSHFELLTRKFL